MLFTSIPFVFFLFVVFVLHWFLFNRNYASQNTLLLISSYFFYGWWDWRFLFLLFFISVSNYFIAILIQTNDSKPIRKFYFILGLIVNIGTLVIFKYFNFFIDGFVYFISLFNFKINLQTLNIILPVGISFYIFLSISYLIDNYLSKLPINRNLFDVLLALSFFPIILAGPIQRPITLLPQIQNLRIFNYTKATDGLRQILWGVFMKIVIADRAAIQVDLIFSDCGNYAGSTLFLGIIFYTVQIYADFAGYSNIAIGIGKLFGFDIMKNFAYPYFALDIREFWKRWNISLTTWFRDYVFLPIAFSISRRMKAERFFFIKTEILIYTIGIIITWTLTGLWHGAKLTFIIWGLLHGLILLITQITTKSRSRLLRRLTVRRDSILMTISSSLFTLTMIMFAWIFFRSDNIGDALRYISGLISLSFLSMPEIRPWETICFIFLFILIEWAGRKDEYAIAKLASKWPSLLRYSLYYVFIMIILWYGGTKQQFIYFQF